MDKPGPMSKAKCIQFPPSNHWHRNPRQYFHVELPQLATWRSLPHFLASHMPPNFWALTIGCTMLLLQCCEPVNKGLHLEALSFCSSHTGMFTLNPCPGIIASFSKTNLALSASHPHLVLSLLCDTFFWGGEALPNF